MDGSAGEAGILPAAKTVSQKSGKTLVRSPPQADETDTLMEEDRPEFTSMKSDIRLPAPKPTPARKPTPMLKSVANARTRSTPKPVRKAKPKTSPKPMREKMLLARASPKADSAAERSETEDEKTESTDRGENKNFPTEPIAEQTPLSLPNNRIDSQSDAGRGSSAGDRARKTGSGPQSQFAWYGSMLHDRFYSEWLQPTSIASSGRKYSVLVKLRIEKDGRVSRFDVIEPSGNATVDESVAAVGRRVTAVDPLPAGLGSGSHYDVKINFELNSEP
jgi:TonB family protein